MPLKRAELIESLRACEKRFELYTTPDGSELLLLPYGGRVLGLFAPGQEENFYWTHPALSSPESARAFYASSGWPNSGGDRTWLAPEIDFFFPQFPDTAVYCQPAALDPGNYEVIPSRKGIRFVSTLALTLSRSARSVRLRLAKSWGPAANPLRTEPSLNSFSVEYAGYTQRTCLRFLDASDSLSADVGVWNLLQLPHGGELLIPTYGCVEPRILVGAVDWRHISASQSLLRYRMCSAGVQKIAVTAASTTGRVGYSWQFGSGWGLVVRNFFVNPSDEYIDVPWTCESAMRERGYAVQACNVDHPLLGRYSELEYHAPAIGGVTGRVAGTDVSQVWVFRASHEVVRALSRALLGAEV